MRSPLLLAGVYPRTCMQLIPVVPAITSFFSLSPIQTYIGFALTSEFSACSLRSSLCSYSLQEISKGRFMFTFQAVAAKGRTIRKVMGGGGGGGGFSACTIFFFRPLLVQEFFLQVKPSARIFFQTNIALFVVYVLTSWSARAGTRGFPRTSMRNGLLTRVRITIFSCLISPNLFVQPMFKFLLLTENTKTET